jgi:hypothetical protein
MWEVKRNELRKRENEGVQEKYEALLRRKAYFLEMIVDNN